eukprot:366012-Chlamydomonas_euryale.AAC.15
MAKHLCCICKRQPASPLTQSKSLAFTIVFLKFSPMKQRSLMASKLPGTMGVGTSLPGAASARSEVPIPLDSSLCIDSIRCMAISPMALYGTNMRTHISPVWSGDCEEANVAK